MVGANHASSNRHLDEAPERFTMTSHLKISTSVPEFQIPIGSNWAGREHLDQTKQLRSHPALWSISFISSISVFTLCVVQLSFTILNFFAIFSNTQFLTTTINKQTNKKKTVVIVPKREEIANKTKKEILMKRKETSSKFFQNDFLKVNEQHVRHSLITYFCAASRLYDFSKSQNSDNKVAWHLSNSSFKYLNLSILAFAHHQKFEVDRTHSSFLGLEQ